ncbi:MAG TPA: efflux RND transporter periplasmic adaptor subunit, partial [Polyangiaceae bacterium]|nr:efflux RND transporter periplasmic adaptor subunit [Polyangiaceae bacterium]
DRIVPEREMQESEAELSTVQAEHRAAAQALSALSAVRGQGARFTLTASVAGSVIERKAVRGRMVGEQELLYSVGDLTRLWLVTHAFERDALRVRVGSSARANFAALPNESFTGKVTWVGGRVDPKSRTVEVRVELDNAAGVLRPGMSATAVIPIGDSKETVIAVPVQAVQRIEQHWCVFVPSQQEGQFEVRRIGRGRDLGSELEVLSGLKPGERVVVDGAFLLKAEAEKRSGGASDHHH